MAKPHQTADPETFNTFREEWIANNVTVEQALAVPGVAELLLEEFNNRIIDAFDEEHEDDDEQKVDGHPACECGRAKHLCKTHEDPDADHEDV